MNNRLRIFSKQFLLILALNTLSFHTFSQSANPPKYNARVSFSDEFFVRGRLHSVTDSGIILIVRRDSMRINYRSIEKIRIWKKGSGGEGAAIGAGAGLLLGGISGYGSIKWSANDDGWAVPSGMFFGTFGMIVGAAIGSIAGKATGEKMEIKHSLELFNLFQMKFTDYANGTVP